MGGPWAGALADPWASRLVALHASRRPAVAVSGGADSMALALIARAWGEPLALIVDHGLRAGSAKEAAVTSDRLAARGIPFRILTLSHLAAGPALAARARAARYDALTAAARAAGRVDLWLGHHRSDQAETVLMRRAAQSGCDGLAGMAWVRETRELRLLRPLLDTAPATLRALLSVAGIAWVEDPSNQDRTTGRARLRAGLNDPGGTGAPIRDLADAAAAHAAARERDERRIAAELADRAAIFPEGYALLAPGPLSAGALAALIRGLTGAPYRPHGEGVARLAAEPRPAVLGGIRLMDAGKLGPGLLLVREAAALAPAIPAEAGALWDRRFQIEDGRFQIEDVVPDGATIGAVGAAAAALRRTTGLPAAVLQTLPALRVQGTLVEVPHIGYRPGSGSARMAVSFAPATPASGAPFGV